MRRAIIPVLIFIVLTLGVVFAMEEVQLSSARREVARLRSAAESRNLPRPQHNGAGSGAVVSEAAKDQPALDSPSGGGTQSESTQSPNRKRMGQIGRMLRDNPAFHRLMRAQAEREVDKEYAALYRKLGLKNSSPLAELLKQKATRMADAMTKSHSGDLTDAERQTLWREAEEAGENVESQIKELLGSDAYAVYEEYNNTLQERQQVEALKEKLYSAGLDLAPSQEEALVSLLHQARIAPLTPEENAEVYALSTSLPEKRHMKPELVELKRMEAIHQRYLDGAAQFMTPEQLKVYEEYLNQWHDYWDTLADYQPSPDIESHDGAEAKVASDAKMPAQPVHVSAGESEPEQWGDVQNGSSCTVSRTSGNMLGVKFDVGSGWGSGLTFYPDAPAKNADNTVNAAGAGYLTVRLKAPAGITLRFGLLESGANWLQATRFDGVNGADGEAYRHPGIITQDGWQTYRIPLTELKLNGGFGNQKGNRTIDTPAIKGIEILVPGGQPSCEVEIESLRLD